MVVIDCTPQPKGAVAWDDPDLRVDLPCGDADPVPARPCRPQPAGVRRAPRPHVSAEETAARPMAGVHPDGRPSAHPRSETLPAENDAARVWAACAGRRSETTSDLKGSPQVSERLVAAS